MKPRGFTPWELLAVLAIILVVAAILFPVFAKSHGCSRCPSCASNLKQIGLAIAQYAQDNDEMMPDISRARGSLATWRWATKPYTKSKDVFQCPSREKGFCSDGYPLSYAANYSGNYNGTHFDKGNGAFAGPGSLPLSLSGFKDPTHLIELCEVADSPTPEFNIDDAARFSPSKHILWAGHSGLSNYLFADGHVKAFRPLGTRGFWYRDRARPLTANGIAVLTDTQKRFYTSGATP